MVAMRVWFALGLLTRGACLEIQICVRICILEFVAFVSDCYGGQRDLEDVLVQKDLAWAL